MNLTKVILLSYIRKNNWQPVLVTIPVTAILENGLLDDYKQVYLDDNLDKVEKQGVVYLDYTARQDFTNNLLFFGDADHLNKDGAKVFSYLLLRDLIANGFLPENADGYDYSLPALAPN